ncbi:MAG: response regulator transcription factor [Rhodococcus sp. (in: high G+C Gram-positive bacteria)]|uniref:Response regulator, two-component system n=2 Tax=Rhodococcus TaxID=1827 RepID=A0A379PST6_9NOCA|nr:MULTISPECIES: response regulator transcription factor [Rhodococcus]UTT50991.1 response regulator transcription factor [Rhodococcus gordoniae]SUF09175.1 response regulator, two-component system [Rhodococcus gordoniae]
MIRLMLADDHAIVRAGLRALLELHSDAVSIVAEASTGQQAVALCREGGIDLVLMDLRFGTGLSGVEATSRIRALPNAPRVLVVTNYDTDAEILRAIEAGASGYLLKDTAPAELFTAIVAAAGGASALSPSVASKLMAQMRAGPTLTPREIQVLEAVAAGFSNREIARRMFLSEGTVKTHLTNTFGKLGVRSRTAAVAQARARGIIDGTID